MSTELASWPRPHFDEGGGNPSLLYLVFGTFDRDSFAIRGSEYRTQGVPDGVDVIVTSTASAEAKMFTSDVLGSWLDEQPELSAAVRAAPQMLVYRGELPDYDTLDYLRDTVGTITALLEHGGVGVLDGVSLRWYSPESFRSSFFLPDAPAVHAHVSILLSREDDDGDTHWIHTRGMRKFGRPDFSARGVKPAQRGAMVELFNRLIELGALGSVIPEAQPVTMNGLPHGYRAFHGGSLDDPDFNNVHVELRRVRGDDDEEDEDDDE